MRCSIFLRASVSSGHWILGKTANVSVLGAYFASKVELPREQSVEYVLTFPPELTHAPSTWGVRFYGSVVRVEPHTGATDEYGVALNTSKHRYLSPEESAGFSSMDEAQAAR